MKGKGRPGHRTTTAHIQAAYPFVAEGGLGGRGVYIGRDVYGGSFCYDPWVLYQQGRLTNPNICLAGQIGRGKSALAKSFASRCIAFGRRVYASLVDLAGSPAGWVLTAALIGVAWQGLLEYVITFPLFFTNSLFWIVLGMVANKKL